MTPTRRFALAAIALTWAALPTAAQGPIWIDQFGTSAIDSGFACSSDGFGGVYVGGGTNGSLAAPHAGFLDAWFARHDAAGNQLWIRQLGTSDSDACYASATDGVGGVFFAGSTGGSLAGPSAGFLDAWVARYDSAGNPLWIRQLGTSDVDGISAAVSDGSGGVWVGGRTEGTLGTSSAGDSDCWIAHYDAAGNQTWIRQFGSSGFDDLRAAAASSSGGIYFAGATWGSLAGPGAGQDDAWLAHFDSAGNQVWIRQIGTFMGDVAFTAAPDASGGVYVGGTTFGALAGPALGGVDGWLAHYDGAGNQTWARQIGTNLPENLHAAAANGSGGVFVSGSTAGSIGGPQAGGGDVWLANYDSTGAVQSVQQFGSVNFEVAESATPDGSGSVFLTGSTYSSLDGPQAGLGDVFVAHMGAGCASASATYCTAKVNSLGCTPAIAMSSAPIASASSGCTLSVTNVVGAKFGIFFHSTSGANSMPFHGGFLCVSPPLLRHGLLNSGGTDGTCTGTFSEDFNAYIAAGTDPALVAGAQVWIQNWSRDPAAPFADGLSDAVTATICP